MYTGSIIMRNRSYNKVSGYPTNQNYEEDVQYTLQLCRWVLKPIGIWPLIYDRTNNFEKLCAVALRVTCFSALCFVLIPSGYYTFFEEKNIRMKVKLLGPVIFCLTSTIKYCYLGLRGDAFGRCIKHIERDWKYLESGSNRAIMIRNVLVSRRLTTLCAVFLYVGGMSYHTAMPLLSKTVSANVTIRSLTYPGYDVFFDSQTSPAYEIVFFIHCLFALITYNITTAACSLAAIFVTHACGQIQIQIARLANLVEESDKKGVEKSIALIVSDHVRVLRFSRYVDEILREIFLMEIVTSTVIICLLEYYCIMEWENSDAVAISTYCILLISFTFNILIFCYIGELLVEQGSKIGDASYEIEWYKLPEKKALGLIFLIAISKYPPKITAGKIFVLSLDTFSMVLKSSLVYLSLLRTIAE